jgi:hypothetical protein
MFFAAFVFYLTGFGVLLSDFLRRLDFSYFWAVVGGIFIALSLCFLIGGMLRDSRLADESPDSLP